MALSRLYLSIAFLVVPIIIHAQLWSWEEKNLFESHQGRPIHCLHQDAQRWIWMGTSGGIIKYNGFQPKLLQIPELQSQNLDIIDCTHDSKNLLWCVATNNQIYIKDQKDAFTKWQPNQFPIVKKWTSIQIDKSNRIWLGTVDEGIWMFDTDTWYHITTDQGIASPEINQLIQDQQGIIWAATNGGLSSCQWHQGKLIIKSFNRSSGIPDELIQCITWDQKGTLWMGLFDGRICKYDPHQDCFEVPVQQSTGTQILSMACDATGAIWCGTDNNGLWRMDPTLNRLIKVHPIEVKPPARIQNLLVDAEQNLWTTPGNEQLFQLFTPITFYATPFVNLQAVCMTKDHQLWIGTEAGLYHKEVLAGEGKFKKLGTWNVLSLYQDEQGLIWVGTFGEGLYILNAQGHIVHHYQEGSYDFNNNILNITGNKNRIWLSTLGGVYQCNDISKNIHQLKFESSVRNERKPQYIYQTYIDHTGTPWFASDGQGIFQVKDYQVIKENKPGFTSKQSPLKTVYSITEDRSKNIWFNTPNLGLFYQDSTGLQSFNRERGLSSTKFNILTHDPQGNILAVYDDGLDYIDPLLKRTININTKKLHMSLDCNINAFWQNSEYLLIAGTQGLIQWHFSKQDTMIFPKIQLSSVHLNSERLDPKEKRNFQYNQNNLHFTFQGLWFTDPAKLKYQYILAGYDQQWKQSQENAVEYHNLKPGQYTFIAKTCINYDFQHDDSVSYSFIIQPPIWTRWWFLLISGILCYFTIRQYILYRDKKIHRDEELRNEKMRAQLIALQNQMSPHFLFNTFNTLIGIIEESPREAVRFTEKLATFYRSILQYKEQELILLRDELNLVSDYLYLLNYRFGAKIHYHLPQDVPESYIAPLSLQTLVENAVKHNIVSMDHPLGITISLEEDKYIIVRNNLQPKAYVHTSLGSGLANLKKQYEILSAKPIIVESNDQYFIVKVPLIHFKPNEKNIDHRR